ncbi:EcsC family protein [Aliiruegeria haliotis]|uniref:EcsC family protein n=1 Tax=Aliiruegeria haliotis TaxID=1280846 RepID=A0A2T0RZA3_9RHOB|nr:EcsC family protein [Aliiruegeria haliotis]PRY26480.1 EcsC family protein [Aliiruegeria haliotis]
MTDKVPNPRPQAAEVLREALKRQEEFEDQRPTRLGRGAERVTAPVSGLLSRLVPPRVVRQGLEMADRAVGLAIPDNVSGHAVEELAACEAAALRAQAWAVGGNAASGGAAGFFGAPGMTVDIPATIAMAVANVRATGAAYGFNTDSEEERAFRLLVLQVATSGADRARGETLKSLNEMAAFLASPEGRLVLEKGGKWVTDTVVERVARQLGFGLVGRKAGQVVPVVGGAVAAAVNASFQTDVSRAARYAYRQRWLMERRMIAPPDTADAGQDDANGDDGPVRDGTGGEDT